MPKRSYRRWEPDEIDALVTMVHQGVPRAEIVKAALELNFASRGREET